MLIRLIIFIIYSCSHLAYFFHLHIGKHDVLSSYKTCMQSEWQLKILEIRPVLSLLALLRFDGWLVTYQQCHSCQFSRYYKYKMRECVAFLMLVFSSSHYKPDLSFSKCHLLHSSIWNRFHDITTDNVFFPFATLALLPHHPRASPSAELRI